MKKEVLNKTFSYRWQKKISKRNLSRLKNYTPYYTIFINTCILNCNTQVYIQCKIHDSHPATLYGRLVTQLVSPLDTFFSLVRFNFRYILYLASMLFSIAFVCLYKLLLLPGWHVAPQSRLLVYFNHFNGKFLKVQNLFFSRKDIPWKSPNFQEGQARQRIRIWVDG